MSQLQPLLAAAMPAREDAAPRGAETTRPTRRGRGAATRSPSQEPRFSARFGRLRSAFCFPMGSPSFHVCRPQSSPGAVPGTPLTHTAVGHSHHQDRGAASGNTPGTAGAVEGCEHCGRARPPALCAGTGHRATAEPWHPLPGSQERGEPGAGPTPLHLR